MTARRIEESCILKFLYGREFDRWEVALSSECPLNITPENRRRIHHVCVLNARWLAGANGATSSSHRQAQKSKFDPREW